MSWLDHYHKNTQAPSDATKVSPSSQQVDYQYASKVPFGTTNPAVPTYYKKQANAQFTYQGQSSVIKKTDTSKQHAAQKLLNKVEFGNNDLANTVLDFTAKFPIQSGINLMNPQIRNDEDVARVGMDLLGTLPIINEATNLGVKGSKFGKSVYEYGNKAYKDAKVISDAEKLNNSLTPAYQKIKDIPEKIRRIGNIWSQPTMSYSEELDKLNRLKKLNVEEQHLKGITGLDKKQIDDRINHLSRINSSGVHMPENPTLDDLTNLLVHQRENGFDQSIQTYIDHHIALNENRIRYGNLSSPPDLNLGSINLESINLERPIRRARLDQESRNLLENLTGQNNYGYITNNVNRVEFNPNLHTNLSVDPSVPSWIKNTIDKHFNKGLISKINSDDAVVSTNPSLYRRSQNVDEALKETQRMINISPSGTKIRGASSLSDSSFPLVVSNIRRNYLNKNLKDVQFGGYNKLNFSGYLEKANIHHDVVVPYLNSHIDELSKTVGKKIPKAYYNDQGIFYPDLVGVKMQKGGQIFLQPNNPKLKQGYNVPSKYPSTELATSIGGEKGEPAYLIPSFKQGHLLNNPVKEFNNTGEYLGGPFKTWQEADKWEKEVRHPYVEKGQSLPSPLKWWGDKYQSGGSINQNYQTASQVINNTGTLPVFLTRPTPVVIPKHPMLKNITKMQPKWLDTYDVKTEGELQTPNQGFGKYMGSDGVWRADYTLPTHLQQGSNWRKANPRKYGSGGSVKPQVVPTQLDSSTYENNIKNNYQSFIQEHPKTKLPSFFKDEKGMNCINGVTTFINGASGLELKNGNYNSSIGKGKSYTGNSTFNDNSEKEGFYRLNKEDLIRDGFKPGDVVQYSAYKKDAHRFDGNITTKNAFDLYPQHAKIIVDSYDKEGTKIYKLVDNGGGEDYRVQDYTEEELLNHYSKGYGMNYSGLIVHRYNPNETTNRQKSRKAEHDILKGVNPHAKEYNLETLPTYDFSENDPIQGKIKSDKSQFADKLMNVYKKNYQRIGKSSNLPSAVLNKLAIAQIGIAGQESKFGTDEGTLKNLVPDALLDEARTLKSNISQQDNWIEDYYKKNSKDSSFKKQYPNYSDFEKKINSEHADTGGRNKYFFLNSPRSKGVFQQKELSKTGNYLVEDKDLKDFDSQAIGSLALSIDNYHNLQKKYPKLTEDQLVDLTILSHNAPGKALVPEYVKYYLEHKDIDYVNKVRKNIPEYTEIKNKNQLQKVEKDLSHHEVDSIKNFLATNTMIQKHKKGGRVLGLYEMMGMPIPFGFGGSILKGIGDLGVGTADTVLSAVNKDIIPDSAYSDTKFGRANRDFANVAGSVVHTAAPIIANTVLPGSGAALMAVQGASNSFVKKDTHQTDTKQVMNTIDPLLQVGGSFASQYAQNSTPDKKAEGGQVDKAIINVEKGELEVNPNTLAVVKEFRNKPKHPANGIDEQGNTMATVDNIIIPVRTKGLGGQQSLSKEYKNASDLRKKAIINNLKFAQARREGIKYEYGGKIKKYDGSNGSVVGPRADGGFYDFSNPVTTTQTTSVLGGMSNMFATGQQMYTGPGSRYAMNPYGYNPTQGVLPNTNNRPAYTSPMNTNGMKYNPTSINFQPSNDISGVAGTNKYSTSPSQPVDWNKAANIGEKALEYSPAIYNMARGLFDKPLSLNENDYLVKDRVDAPVLTGDAGRRDLLRGYNLGKYNNRQLGGTQAGMNNLFNTYADATSKFNENLENTNKVAKFEASKYNIENKFRNSQTKLGIKQFNEQNKAEKRNQVSKALTQGSDILQNERNNKIISNNLPNFLKYHYNDKDGTFSLKTKTGGTK